MGLWVEPTPPSQPLASRGDNGPHVRGLQVLLALFGYDIEANGVYGAALEKVVAAFQRHYRPERIDGMADAGLVQMLRALNELASDPHAKINQPISVKPR